MLKVRIIPTLLWNGAGLVKGVGFDSWRGVGAVLPAIKVYCMRDVDELILVDINATAEGRSPDYASIEEFSSECFVPLTVGGGIRSIDDITMLLRAGADKVAINTAAYENPELIRKSADRFGSQCIVVSIDARRAADGEYECYSNSGRTPTRWRPIEWARKVEDSGAGEILLTSIERDGSMSGYDLDVIGTISNAVSIPVIASGGAANYSHFHQAITEAGANAVAAASMFHFTELTPLGAKKYLAGKGVPVRRGREVRP